jgi:hypothetical protein
MIVLAVITGFFAENIREDQSDAQKEKDFILSMIEDIKSDSVQIVKTIAILGQREVQIDSLVNLLTEGNFEHTTNRIYYLTRQIIRGEGFVANSRTLQQLKNAGGLRLIRDKEASNAIIAYDQFITFTLISNGTLLSLRVTLKDKLHLLLNAKVLSGMVDKNSRIHEPKGNIEPISIDKSDINKIAVDLVFLKGAVNLTRLDREKELVKIADTIKLLQTKYNLE